MDQPAEEIPPPDSSPEPCDQPDATAQPAQTEVETDPQVKPPQRYDTAHKRRNHRRNVARKTEAEIEEMYLSWYGLNRSCAATGRKMKISGNTVKKYMVDRKWIERADRDKVKVEAAVTLTLIDRITKDREETASTLRIWQRQITNKIKESAGIKPGENITPEMQDRLNKSIAQIPSSAIGKELKNIAETQRILAMPLEPKPQKFEGKITGDFTVSGDGEPTVAGLAQIANRLVLMGN